jgi:hypothetical protein
MHAKFGGDWYFGSRALSEHTHTQSHTQCSILFRDDVLYSNRMMQRRFPQHILSDAGFLTSVLRHMSVQYAG